MDGALYPACICHRRKFPVAYRFVYRLFYLLVDVDRIDALAMRLRWFSHNRFNLLSLDDRDYGHGRRGGLRTWAEQILRMGGIKTIGRIRLLTLPRVLGFAFNPVSFWFCETPDGSLRAVIAEVRNTFGERHSYLLAPDATPLAGQWLDKDKCFHVSPFIELVGRYRFVFAEPGERVRVVIREYRDGALMLVATLAGQRRTLSDGAIVRQVLSMPWMTLKVVAGIHWEALKLWLRGAPFHRKPVPPLHEVT